MTHGLVPLCGPVVGDHCCMGNDTIFVSKNDIRLPLCWLQTCCGFQKKKGSFRQPAATVSKSFSVCTEPHARQVNETQVKLIRMRQSIRKRTKAGSPKHDVTHKAESFKIKQNMFHVTKLIPRQSHKGAKVCFYFHLRKSLDYRRNAPRALFTLYLLHSFSSLGEKM